MHVCVCVCLCASSFMNSAPLAWCILYTQFPLRTFLFCSPSHSLSLYHYLAVQDNRAWHNSAQLQLFQTCLLLEYIYIYILTHIVFLLSCVAQWIEPKLKTLLCCLYCLSLQLRSFSESWLSLVFGASVAADLHWFFFSIWNRWDTSCPAWTDVWGFIFSHSLCTKWPLKW